MEKSKKRKESSGRMGRETETKTSVQNEMEYIYIHRQLDCVCPSHRLGAWQFMADMPYNSIALLTLWQILWTLYHYQLSNHTHQSNRRPDGASAADEGRNRGVSVLLDFSQMPQTAEEIQRSIRGC